MKPMSSQASMQYMNQYSFSSLSDFAQSVPQAEAKKISQNRKLVISEYRLESTEHFKIWPEN